MDTQDTTTDALLGGRVRLIQPKSGYRAGMDAALLAAAVEAAPGERAVEAGCGPGAALLQAAMRCPGARFLGVERAAAPLAWAQESILLNEMAERVEAIEGDVDAGAQWLRGLTGSSERGAWTHGTQPPTRCWADACV